MARERICGVYKITSPSGNFYIGSSVDVLSRWSGHKSELRSGKHHCQPLQRAVIKYGIGTFTMEILRECEYKHVRNLEQNYINYLSPEYNSSKCVEESLSDLWKDPEFRKNGVKRCSEQNAKWRKDPNWVKKQKESASTALSNLHKDPEFKKAHVIRVTERIQRLVNSSDEMKYKAAEGRRKRMAKDKANPEAWEKRNAKIRELQCLSVRCIETGYTFKSQKEAGEWLKNKHGFKSFGHISSALSGRITKAYGYHWRFADA